MIVCRRRDLVRLCVVLLLVASPIGAGARGADADTGLRQFVLWFCAAALADLPPAVATRQLTEMGFDVQTAHRDPDNLILRAYPRFTDAIVKLRFQRAPRAASGEPDWLLLDASAFLPDAPQRQMELVAAAVAEALGPARGSATPRTGVEERVWRARRGVDVRLLVDNENGNIEFRYAVLQGLP